VPAELEKLQRLIDRALAETAALWPPVAEAYDWVFRIAHVLGDVGATGELVRDRLAGLTGAMAGALDGPLAAAKRHFLKVTRSYWPGLFWCYDVPGLPRTNNDLEQFFGSVRYHQRRATGRKQPGPALVVRGAARLIAAAATRHGAFTADDLAEADPAAWSRLRLELNDRRQRRVDHRRFRRDPDRFLRELEASFIQSGLPA
jgi:hypothetical protein